MAQPCKVCNSAARTLIEAALMGGAPYRDIALQHGISAMAVSRHKQHMALNLPVTVGEAVEMRREERDLQAGLNVAAWLQRDMETKQRLQEACEEQLRDPEDPQRYFLGPRAEEVMVTYNEWLAGDEKPRRAKAPLQSLLDRVASREHPGLGINPETTVIRGGDIRKLLLEILAESRGQLTFVAGVLEKALAFQEAAARAQAAAEVPEEEARREFEAFYRRHGFDAQTSAHLAGLHFLEEE